MYNCQMNAADRAEFPQASRVVRVGNAAWNSEDDDLLEQLSAIIERRVRQQKPHTLETLSALLEPPPRVRLKTKTHVHVSYGPRMIFVDEENQMSADIRGLVFDKNCANQSEGQSYAEFVSRRTPGRHCENQKTQLYFSTSDEASPSKLSEFQRT